MSEAFYDNDKTLLREVWRDGIKVVQITPEAMQDMAALTAHPWHYLSFNKWKPGAIHGDIKAIPLEYRP